VRASGDPLHFPCVYPPHSGILYPSRGGQISTGVTCGGLCLRKAKHARKSVPAHSRGECEGTWFPHAPTGDTPSMGVTCGKLRLQTGKKCTQVRASPFWWGVSNVWLRQTLLTPTPIGTLLVNTIFCPDLCVFAPLREALPGLYQQSQSGCEGTRFPRAPCGGHPLRGFHP
jgi:hypothetical protein